MYDYTRSQVCVDLSSFLNLSFFCELQGDGDDAHPTGWKVVLQMFPLGWKQMSPDTQWMENLVGLLRGYSPV